MSSINPIYNPISETLGLTHIPFEYGLPEPPDDSINVWAGEGELNSFYGKTHSEEAKKIMSDATKE